ncbi:two-component regulator propeller domain-containing protein [Fulvivirga sp.]|uniref:ligand-binding sensor domain-containing protein n=1 Tax=Fulvivirga sp. TaxID=1931237 RepID=UPI0032ED85C1
MTKFRTYIAVAFLLYFYSATPVYSQLFLNPNKTPDQYNYEHWSSDEGLPDNAVINLLQSRDGYIWFASYGGVTRFNGVEFYTYSSYTHAQIVNNSFTFIYEDLDGAIWAATSGNGIVSIKNEQVNIYTVENGLPSNFAESFAQGADSILYVATSEGLVYKRDSVFTNDGLPRVLKNKYLVSLTVDAKNHLWVLTNEDGVYELYQNTILNHFTVESGLLSNQNNYVKFQKGKIYIGGTEGLNIIDDGRISTISQKDGLKGKVVNSSQMSDNGWLWIGSYNGFCRTRNGKVEYFSDQHPISGRDITSLLEDSEGNIWASTYRGGLYKFWEGKFTNYCDYSIGPTEPYTVHSIIQKTSDDYILVYEEGVSEVNTKTNKLRTFDDRIKEVSSKLKTGILSSDGTLYVGSQRGLIIYKGGKYEVITAEQELIDDNVRVLFEDSQERIWAGTVNGITVFDFKNGTHFNLTAQEGLSHGYIMSISEDAKGNFWIGTRSGLNYYDHGKFTKYNYEDGLVGDFVFKTYTDKENTLWILGNAGITRFKNGEFKIITTKNGLNSNTVFQILEDDDGYFWFTTNQKNVSVFKVLKSELDDFCDGKIGSVNSIAYDRSDGIKATAATSSAASIRANDGKLWFATQFGVEVIDPNQIKVNEIRPPVVVEFFKVNDEPYNLDKDIVVPAGKNRIGISFASLSYRYPSKNQYKYQLVGYDDDWIISKGERETSYTNLPPGDYVFKVIAANNDKIWNEEGAIVSFRIKPAFYQTTWFIVFSILTVFAIVVLIYNLRVSSLKRTRARLEKLVAERTMEILQKKEEIETQNEEIDAQRLQIEKQHDELKKVNTKLEEIVEQRTHELKETYDELLDVNKELDTFIYRSVHDIRGPIARLQGLSHLIKMQTNDSNVLNLVGLLNGTAEEMNDIFYRLINVVRLKTSDLIYTNVNIEIAINNALHKFKTSPLKDLYNVSVKIPEGLGVVSSQDTLEIILYQLFDNAIKFRHPDKKADILVEGYKEEDGTLILNVTDWGIGIKEDQTQRIFDMFFVGNDNISSAGLGLYTVRTATKVLKSTIELTQNALKGGKTTFKLTLFNHSKY